MQFFLYPFTLSKPPYPFQPGQEKFKMILSTKKGIIFKVIFTRLKQFFNPQSLKTQYAPLPNLQPAPILYPTHHILLAIPFFLHVKPSQTTK